MLIKDSDTLGIKTKIKIKNANGKLENVASGIRWR